MGWTNNKLEMAWLERFLEATKHKARRSWRLLICDSHDGHMTMQFIPYAIEKRILIMAFLFHFSHTLQPLNVGVFAPLVILFISTLFGPTTIPRTFTTQKG
jgi:hypothetical protein